MVGTLREGFVPEKRHDRVGGDDAIVVQRQRREQGPLLGAAQVERGAVTGHGDRPEDADVEPDHDRIIAGRRAGPTGPSVVSAS